MERVSLFERLAHTVPNARIKAFFTIMKWTPIIACSLLVASTLVLTGCNRSRERVGEDGPGRQRMGRVNRNIAMIVPNPNDPWTASLIQFAKKAAEESRGTFEVLPIRANTDEAVAEVIGAAAGRDARGLLIQLPNAERGLALRDAMERFGMTGAALFVRPVNPETPQKRIIDLPYVGMEDTDLGAIATLSATEEARRRQWNLAQVRAIVFTQPGTPRFATRASSMRNTLVNEGIPAANVRVIAWSGDNAQGAAAAALAAGTNTIVVGPADAPVIAAMRAAEGKGIGANNLIGVGIGGLDVQGELQRESGFFGSLVLSPKAIAYDAVKAIIAALEEGEAKSTLPTFVTGTMMTRANQAQVVKDLELDQISAEAKRVQP